MSHGSWLMAHGSWLMSHGSWLMAHGSCSRPSRFTPAEMYIVTRCEAPDQHKYTYPTPVFIQNYQMPPNFT